MMSSMYKQILVFRHQYEYFSCDVGLLFYFERCSLYKEGLYIQYVYYIKHLQYIK